MGDSENYVRLSFSPLVRGALIALTIAGVATMVEALIRFDIIRAIVSLATLLFIAPPALFGRVPNWWLGLSPEELKEMYQEPFRVPGDTKGIVTGLFVGAFVALLIFLSA